MGSLLGLDLVSSLTHLVGGSVSGLVGLLLDVFLDLFSLSDNGFLEVLSLLLSLELFILFLPGKE